MRVIVDKDEDGNDKLGFEYLDGPVTPKPEKLPAVRPKAKRRSSPRPKPKGGKGDGGGKRLGAEGAADQGLSRVDHATTNREGRAPRPAFAFLQIAHAAGAGVPVARLAALWDRSAPCRHLRTFNSSTAAFFGGCARR